MGRCQFVGRFNVVSGANMSHENSVTLNRCLMSPPWTVCTTRHGMQKGSCMSRFNNAIVIDTQLWGLYVLALFFILFYRFCLWGVLKSKEFNQASTSTIPSPCPTRKWNYKHVVSSDSFFFPTCNAHYPNSAWFPTSTGGDCHVFFSFCQDSLSFQSHYIPEGKAWKSYKEQHLN